MRLISYLALVAAFSQPVFSQESISLEDERQKQLQQMGSTLPDICPSGNSMLGCER